MSETFTDFSCEYGCPECPRIRKDNARLTREVEELRGLLEKVARGCQTCEKLRGRIEDLETACDYMEAANQITDLRSQVQRLENERKHAIEVKASMLDQVNLEKIRRYEQQVKTLEDTIRQRNATLAAARELAPDLDHIISVFEDRADDGYTCDGDLLDRLVAYRTAFRAADGEG